MAEVRAPGRSTHGAITPSSLTRGSRLGRYELLAPIGAGGMAKVWAARQSGFGGFEKVVAIKTILPHLSRESDFERLFVDEARVASLVRHPNVCEIFELSEEGQVLFLVMEWVDGDSLIKVLKPGGELLPIDPRIAARIAAETCAGLHAAHVQVDHDGKPLNIVHRDVSPHNVLLSAEGVVKVTDFGVAKAVGQTHDQTVAGQLKGKLEYMSPEQITGARVDGRTDVFGMGGVIYEATTGQQPFASAGDLEAMTKIVEGRLAPPSTHFRRYPPELEAIVMRAMANDPAQRFASADEMRGALEAWIARSGPPVTHAEVAGLLRSRVGPKMDERLDRIRSAMSASPVRSPSHTPSAAGISTSGVIATNRPPRVAPVPPPLPQVTAPLPQVTAPKPKDRPPQAQTPAELAELLGPDSGFNMDTVADFQIPDFLNPGQVPLAPAAPRAGAPLPAPPPNAGPMNPRATDTVILVPDATSDSRQYIIAAAIGVAVALGIGGVAFFVWRSLTPTSTPPAPVTHPVQHSQVAPSSQGGGTPASASDISFRVVPSTAKLFLDGRALPDAERTLPRLPPGRTAILVVRASGYADETLRLDDSVTGPVDVVLSTQQTKVPVATNTQ